MNRYSISRQMSSINLSEEDNCTRLSHHSCIHQSQPHLGSGKLLSNKVTSSLFVDQALFKAASNIYSDVDSGSKVLLDFDVSPDAVNSSSRTDSMSTLGSTSHDALSVDKQTPRAGGSHKHATPIDMWSLTSISKKSLSMCSGSAPMSANKDPDENGWDMTASEAHQSKELSASSRATEDNLNKSQFQDFPKSPPHRQLSRNYGRSSGCSHLTLSHIGKNTVTYSPFRYSPRSGRSSREQNQSHEALASRGTSSSEIKPILPRRQSDLTSLPILSRFANLYVDDDELLEVEEEGSVGIPRRSPSVVIPLRQYSAEYLPLPLNRADSLALCTNRKLSSPFRSVKLRDKDDVLDWFGIRSSRKSDLVGSPTTRNRLAPLWEIENEDENE